MNPIYKYCKFGTLTPTNMLYAPLMNENQDRLMMVWDETHPYQKENKKVSHDIVEFFFKREVEMLEVFKHKTWCPTVYDINERTITIEWNGKNTLSYLQYENKLDKQCPIWKSQIKQIIQDIHDMGYYKMSLYPHSFFLTKDGIIKTIDFYSCVSMNKRFMPLSNILELAGPDSNNRFANATVDNMIDFDIFFKETMTIFLSDFWKDNPFPDLYNDIYHE